MSEDARWQLRVLVRQSVLGASLVAGTMLTWSAAWVGLTTALQPTCGYPNRLTAKLRVKAAGDATAQYMMDNSSNCPRGIDELVSQKYLDRNNAKDPWGKALIVHCPATSDSPSADILSAGPDQQEGTPDDIKSWEL